MEVTIVNGTIMISLGIAGVLALLYIFVEVMNYRHKNMSFLHGVIIYLIYQRKLEKQIPKGWKNNTKLYDFGSIRKVHGYTWLYSVVQQLDSEADGRRVYTFVYINWRGAIIKNDLADVCRQHEETMDQDLLKSFRREMSLSELGITENENKG